MLAGPLLREHFQILGSFFFFYRVQTLQFYWIGTAVLSKRLGFFSPGLPNYLESVRVNIGCPVVRTDCRSFGRRTVKWLQHFLKWVDSLTRGAPQVLASALLLAINENEWSVPHFCFYNQNNSTSSPGLLGNGALTCSGLHFWRHFFVKRKILLNSVTSNWVWWIMRVLLATRNWGKNLNE